MRYEIIGYMEDFLKEERKMMFDKYLLNGLLERSIDDWDLYGNRAEGITNDPLDKDFLGKNYKETLDTLTEMCGDE
ncbi:MAG TPA: hypothetical protein VJB11_00115 [archaeon]|nr:hypothetical protein [archaeon]